MKYLTFCIIFCFTIVVNSQNNENYNYKNTPLSTIIKSLEDKHDITFSFANDLIKDKYISTNNLSINWVELLAVLETQTGLKFQKVSNTQFIIIPQQSNTKLCGYVLDATTKLPIINAIINTSNSSIETNTSGYFSLEKDDDDFFIVSITGYETKEFLYTKDCETIYLTPKDTALDEVIILGYITSGIDRNKDGSLKVTSKTLGILPGLVTPDILQSIQLIPGISTLDESATGIQIRGGSPDQNLILYDNIKLYNTGYFYGMFSLFNPFAAEEATIYRSGTSASYGDRISGIIDISSGDKIPERTKGGFEIDGLSLNGYIKTPLSNTAALYAFARRSYSDVWETPTYNSYVDKVFTNFGTARDRNGNVLELETDDDFSPETSNNTFNFADINTKLILKPNEKNNITLSALYTRNRLDFDFKGGDEVLVDSLITQNKGLSFDWKHKSNNKRHERITAYFSEYNSFYQNNEIKDENDDGVLDLSEINIRKNDIVDIGLNITSTTQINNSQKLSVGYQLSYTDLDVLIAKEKPFDAEKENLVQDNSNLNNALFGDYTLSLKNKAFVNVGLRLVHYNAVNQFLVEPRINFEYPVSRRIRAKVAVERRHQPISQLIEFNHTELRLENNLWRLSDNDQYPLLSSNQISGGFLYHHNRLNIDADAYYKELKGLTTFTNGFSNPLENLEEGKSTIKGLDILLKYKWDNYKIWAGYTFNDITFQFPNLNDTSDKFPGNNDITHQFRLSSALKLDHWEFSLGWQYRTGRPTTPVNSYDIKIDADGENAGVVNFGDINSARLPDFHRLDASILYDFKINTLDAQLGLSFLNLYNRVKPLNLIYKAERKPLDDGGIAVEGTTGATPEEREVILEQVIQRFSLGFTPNVSFRLLF